MRILIFEVKSLYLLLSIKITVVRLKATNDREKNVWEKCVESFPDVPHINNNCLKNWLSSQWIDRPQHIQTSKKLINFTKNTLNLNALVYWRGSAQKQTLNDDLAKMTIRSVGNVQKILKTVDSIELVVFFILYHLNVNRKLSTAIDHNANLNSTVNERARNKWKQQRNCVDKHAKH